MVPTLGEAVVVANTRKSWADTRELPAIRPARTVKSIVCRFLAISSVISNGSPDQLTPLEAELVLNQVSLALR